MTRAVGPHGTELRGDAASTAVWASTPLQSNVNIAGSWSANGRFYVDSNVAEWILLSYGDGNSSPFYYWTLNVTTAGELKWYSYGTSNKTITSAAGVVPTGRYFDAAVRYEAGVVTLYVNGISGASGTADRNTRSDAAHRLNIAFKVFTNGFSILGRALGVSFFNSALPDSAFRRLAGNPWILASRRIIFPTAAAAAALPTLSSATYVPGSITSTGFRPRVTVTF